MMDSLSTSALIISHPSTPRWIRVTKKRRKYGSSVVLFICAAAAVVVACCELALYHEYTKLHPNQGKVDRSTVPPVPRCTNEDSASQCRSLTCTWLAEFLDLNINNAATACQDFNAFVCSKNKVSLHTMRMQGFVKAMMDVYKRRSQEGESEDAAVFRECVRGRGDILDFVQHQGAWPAGQGGCNSTFPQIPLNIAEIYHDEATNVSVEGFEKFLFTYIPEIHKYLRASNRANVSLPGSHWARKAAAWVSEGAACHFAERLHSTGDVNTYVALWKILYFSPFLTQMYKSLYLKSFVQDRRIKACLQLVFESFPTHTLRQGHAIFKSFNENYEQQVGTLWQDIVEKLRRRFRSWGKTAGEVFHFLKETKLNLLPEAVMNGHQQIALLGRSPSYSSERNEVLVPFGVLTVLFFSPSNVDSVVFPYLASELLHPVLRSPDVSSWATEDVVAWNKHLTCIAGNTIDLSDLYDISAAHIALNVLYLSYTEHIAKQYSTVVKLNANFTNEQLFFVLWALGRCGGSAEAVNGPLLHSERFTKAFRCVTGQGMVPAKRCPFWNR